MTKQQIVRIISSTPRDRMKIKRVQCRPKEKSNTVLVTKVGTHRWYCERPSYFWSKFDQSFVARGYIAEQKLLFPTIQEPLGVFDQQGLWWTREELSSFFLVEHFTQNPTQYLWAMSLHTHDVQEVVQKLQKIKPTLSNPRHFANNLHTFVELYTQFYRFQATVYMVFDEMAWEFRKLLLRYLPKENVNTYFPRFLSGEATRKALQKGFIQERGRVEYQTTRGILYAMNLKPQAFYVPPRFFHSFPEDDEIISLLLARNISPKDLQQFLAFRTIVPVGFQINEEAQYTESTGLSAHVGVLMRALAKYLNKPLDTFQSMNVESIVKLLKNKP